MVGPVSAGSPIIEERIDVDGVGVHVRRTEGEGPPVVFSHGNPTDSRDWLPFLERLGRPAIAFDLPGWGVSDRPPVRSFDYSMRGLARFFGRCLGELGVGEYALVVHDWGGLALINALREPERVERLVVINAVAMLPGYRWHWLAKYFWRVPGSGELANATATRAGLRLLSRQANPGGSGMPLEFVDRVWDAWGPGRMRRPMLRLYRSADPGALAAAGYGLERLDCPALVAWGATDIYIPVRYGRAYAERLPNAESARAPRRRALAVGRPSRAR